jgi:hypothetical protein
MVVGRQPEARNQQPERRTLNPEPKTSSYLIKLQGLIDQLLIGFF